MRILLVAIVLLIAAMIGGAIMTGSSTSPTAVTASKEKPVSNENVATQATTQGNNTQIGCSLLIMTMSGKLENSNPSPADCAELKTPMKGSANTCIATAIVMYNRTRGQPDLDRPQLYVRKTFVKACVMLVYDEPETRAEIIAAKVTD